MQSPHKMRRRDGTQSLPQTPSRHRAAKRLPIHVPITTNPAAALHRAISATTTTKSAVRRARQPTPTTAPIHVPITTNPATTIHRATSATIMTTKSAVRHVRQPMPITAPTVAAAMPIRAAAPRRAHAAMTMKSVRLRVRREVAALPAAQKIRRAIMMTKSAGLRAKAALPQAHRLPYCHRRGAAMWMI